METPKAAPIVLVIDDEPLIRRTLVRELRGRYEVLEAGTGDAALEAAAGRVIAAILSDLELGAEWGPVVLRRLRAAGCAAPATLLTGRPEAPEARSALALGEVVGVLAKPWDRAELHAAIDRMAAGR